jgi:molybdopterin converting factor small subunit
VPVTVKLFASLRSRFGQEVLLDLETPCEVSDLIALLQSNGYWTSGARVALNLAFASPCDTVRAGDEVAVIPPVSGG